MNRRPYLSPLRVPGLAPFALPLASIAESGVFVRFRLVEPKASRYFGRLAGYIHISPCYLPRPVWPHGADENQGKRVSSGMPTPWFDLKKHEAGRFHGQISRAGGVAEFPNVTADFIITPHSNIRNEVIELASSPDEESVVKRWEELFTDSLTSFLVSPNLERDADSPETASEMTACPLPKTISASRQLAATYERNTNE